MNNRWMTRSFWLLAVVAAAGLLAWAFMPQPVEVETAIVARAAFRKTIDEDGKTRVRERYVVSAPLAGRLGRVTLKPGAPVERGTLLATLAPSASALLDERTASELAERVGAAEAEQLRASAGVERAGVALDQAKAELARATQLAAKGFTSKESLERSEREAALKSKELKVAEFDSHAADHRLAQAKASLSRARQDGGGAANPQRWPIRSPVAGKVLRVMQESETVVATGAPILELGNPADLEVVVDVLTADAVSIRPGAEVALHHADDARPLSGRVRLIEPAAFTKVSALGVEEQRLNVVIDFASPHEQWRNLGDAYRIDARIVVAERERALIVPVGALFRRDDGWAVFVLADGRARLRSVALGPRNNTHAVAEGGLDEGDTVLVYPGDAVSDGARVKVR